MRGLLSLVIAIVLQASPALADGMRLAGSLWRCTRATDRSQFVITFYPDGGVGGGILAGGEVSPYIFDASRAKPGNWPGKWTQTGRRFTWVFPDQNMQIEGSLTGAGQPDARLIGTETSSGERSAVACTALSRLPKIGQGLVVPRNSRFIDFEKGEGTLKVPAGISLQEQDSR